MIESRIFDKDEFLYKEWTVYQPLQRRGAINAASIEALRTSAYFTANTNIFNAAKFEELEQTDPRSSKDEKAYKKQIKGQKFTAEVIETLEKNLSETEYDDFSKFLAVLKKVLSGVDGITDARLNGIAMELSVMDKTAVVQKDKKGQVLVDPTTKDSEIIRLNQDVEEYMKSEVLPHVPDAIYRYEYDPTKAESATNRERLGADFPFTRYFYEYKQPEAADALLEQFMELEQSLTAKIAALKEGKS